MGLSGLFRSPCFPLWLSVENRAVEFVGLESGLGLEMSEFFSSIKPRWLGWYELFWFVCHFVTQETGIGCLSRPTSHAYGFLPVLE